MNLPTPLITPADLAAALARPEPPTVLDVRWRLGGPPGRPEYLDGHVPGAAFIDLDKQLCGPPGAGGRHPLPQVDPLQDALRAAGVRADRPVVCYDAGDGAPAARLWWTLRWAGHPQVRVLDGGYRAWLAEGRPVESGPVGLPAGDVVVVPGHMPVLDAAGAARVATEGVLLDARAVARFRGETEPVDRVAGHIPGAVNLPVGELTGPDGRLLPADELRTRFRRAGALGGRPVGAYCGSGVTAALVVLGFAAAGVPDPALYVGSWSEWITDVGRPVATGAQIP